VGGKSKFAAMLTGDQQRLAQLAEDSGELSKAAEHYARAEDFSRAISLAIKAGSKQATIRYAFKAALGADSGVPAGATASQAGEMLVASGLLQEALLLFELGSNYSSAGNVAIKLKQPLKAAELYEKGGDWGPAAIYYESAGRLAEAVRMLGLRSRALQQQIDRHRDPESAAQEKRQVDDRHASLLAKLGRHSEAANVVSGQEATPQSAELLERSGRPTEAFEAHLQMEDKEAAYQVALRMQGLDPAVKAGFLERCGHLKEAAAELSRAGLHQKSARLLEKEKLWPEAALVWEQAGDALAAGAAYRRAGDYESAGRCFKEAGKPDLAADAFSRLGRHSDAVTFYLQAGQTQQAAQAYANNNQFTEAATYYLHGGERGAAIDALRKIRPGAKDYNSACLKIASLLLEDGKADRALSAARKISDDPREVGNAALDRLYWEGRCLEDLDRGKEALEVYERLAQIAPDHEDVGQRLAAPLKQSSGNARELSPGKRVADRYDIVAELGRGGMGCVYRARDRELDEDVAIKVVLHPGGKGSIEEARLIREVQICRKITHPNIVRVYDIGRFDDGLFISMELLKGESLAELISREGALPLERAKQILVDILAGVHEAHSQKVVHRDLKPHNIFLTAERTKVLDFGIAQGQSFDTRLTMTGQAMGTPLYMAPEQLQGQPVDERTDLYSLGIVAYEMLSGTTPFEGNNPAVVALDHVGKPPPDLREKRPGLPEPWAEWIHRLLSKAPDQRLPSVAHALNAVHALPVA